MGLKRLICLGLALLPAAGIAQETPFSGKVTGVFDGQVIDAPLSCKHWGPNGFREANTEEGSLPWIKVSIFPDGTQGSIQAKSESRNYQWVVIPASGMEFESTDTKASLEADLIERGTEREYAISLLFECP